MFSGDTLKKSCNDTVGTVSGGLEELIDDPCRADGLKSMSQVFRTVTSSPSMLEDLNRDTIFEVVQSED